MLIFALHRERSSSLINSDRCLITFILAPWWWKSSSWRWGGWRFLFLSLFAAIRRFEVSLAFFFESIGSFYELTSLLLYSLLPIYLEYCVGRWILNKFLTLSFNECFLCPRLQQWAWKNGWRKLGQVLLVLIVFEHGTRHSIRLE